MVVMGGQSCHCGTFKRALQKQNNLLTRMYFTDKFIDENTLRTKQTLQQKHVVLSVELQESLG
jgi:hypothetical protein